MGAADDEAGAPAAALVATAGGGAGGAAATGATPFGAPAAPAAAAFASKAFFLLCAMVAVAKESAKFLSARKTRDGGVVYARAEKIVWRVGAVRGGR